MKVKGPIIMRLSLDSLHALEGGRWKSGVVDGKDAVRRVVWLETRGGVEMCSSELWRQIAPNMYAATLPKR